VAEALRLRSAVTTDVEELLRVEREANLPALGHVFPPEQFPYPDDGVRRRWADVLADPTCSVTVALVGDEPADEEVVGFVAWRGGVVEHVGVHPSYQRRGLATRLLAHATGRMTRDVTPSLWVLVDNDGARSLYSRLGWAETGRHRRAEFPPFPDEIELLAP
jgi:ribosomal protein S18 acetylase RimI-like enzyme